jgi:hypothetical protein
MKIGRPAIVNAHHRLVMLRIPYHYFSGILFGINAAHQIAVMPPMRPSRSALTFLLPRDMVRSLLRASGWIADHRMRRLDFNVGRSIHGSA